MSLDILTFDNQSGGNCLFKALGHPLVVSQMKNLVAGLEENGPVAIYDPHGFANSVHALYGLDSVSITDAYVQRLEDLGQEILQHPVKPITDIAETTAETIFVAAFDADRLLHQIEPLLNKTRKIVTLDEARLPDEMLSDTQRYLSPNNFATNFAFFSDDVGIHTRLISSNYWFGYGARDVRLWLRLFDAGGRELASWTQQLPNTAAGFVIDSRHIRSTHKTGAFTGQLFIHVINVVGHDVVKYALDLYRDDGGCLSCTHDANAWPSELYAGLPAPDSGETVVLWVQNSHPIKIPAESIGLNRMGQQCVTRLKPEIGPFATHKVNVNEVLPEIAWPEQIEIQAGKYMVRPRYQIETKVNKRIAHVNIERNDLAPDASIPQLGKLIGKGYILPAPLMPVESFDTTILPTPMATTQTELPTKLLVYSPDGKELLEHSLGRLPRDHAVATRVNDLLRQKGLDDIAGWGHVELAYDFSQGGEADGWLHAVFRYRNLSSGHMAETSFGSHIFNIPATYRSEPQSYGREPPGLSTRLYLRLGAPPLDTFCFLVYPASARWREYSDTTLMLVDSSGNVMASENLKIPCGGSRMIYINETFGIDPTINAGSNCYVQVRDKGCRLFGYHGLTNGQGAFSLDHMFGF